jgi:pimeloyl-ACP methyl ester carboxylesterase
MPNITANGIRIEYEIFGKSDNPTILLISDIGNRSLLWEDSFCDRLAERGRHVVRFDNRDSGLSTIFKEKGAISIKDAYIMNQSKKSMEPPYRLKEMADDAIGLLNALRINSAHICGMSLGGMIACIAGYRHPRRVMTLASIMNGFNCLTILTLEAITIDCILSSSPNPDSSGFKENLDAWRTICGPKYPLDENQLKNRIRQAKNNIVNPEGTARQLMAFLSHQFRKANLESISAPTLLITSSDDSGVFPNEDEDIIGPIPNTCQLKIDETDGNSPDRYQEVIVDALFQHTQRVH